VIEWVHPLPAGPSCRLPSLGPTYPAVPATRMQPRLAAFALLVGIVAVVPRMSCAAEFYELPRMAAYDPMLPLDEGYPANLPTDLPAAPLPRAGALSSGTSGACAASVSAVLAANGRSLLAAYLGA
jgi:hypothetical protein